MSELHRDAQRFQVGCLKVVIALTVLGGLLVVATGGVVLWKMREPGAPVGQIGDPVRGRRLVSSAVYGCTACHIIPGVTPAGLVGPPLTRFGLRSYIAGEFVNEPITLQHWIEHPQQMKPGSAMPDLGVTPQDSRDIAAYLAELR